MQLRTKKFCKDVERIFLERLDALLTAIKLEWQYYVLRSHVWSDYKALSSAPYNEEYGFFESNIEPQDVNEAENYLKVLETRKLRRLADKMHIPMPDTSVEGNYSKISWDFDKSEPIYLTRKGLLEVLPAIRLAKREQRDAAGFWFGIAVGVIGALTGLVSVLT